MLFRIAICAFSVAEGVQVNTAKGGQKPCTTWCRDAGCPKGFGCCVNTDDMAVLSKSRQVTTPTKLKCIKKGNSWCTKAKGEQVKLVRGAQTKVCTKPNPGNNGLGEKPKCYCAEMGCQPGNTCCINDSSKRILQSHSGAQTKEVMRKCMASGKNSWCNVAGGRNKKGSRVQEDCVIEISKTTSGAPLEQFNCRTREVWSDEKTNWCCANKNLGCTTTPPPPPVDPIPVKPPVAKPPSVDPIPVKPPPPVVPVPVKPPPIVVDPIPSVEPEPPLIETTTPPLPTKPIEASAVDDPHLTDIAGDKFDLYSAGAHDLIVIPQGATSKTANLIVSGEVEQFGERKNDLWIRTLNIRGKWVQGGSYSFKTNNAPFGNKAAVLVRRGKSNPWVTVDNVHDSNLVITSDLDSKAPDADFSESVAKKAEVNAGPVTVQVSWATAQKQGDDVNHLDVHVKGLGAVEDAVGGLLAGEISS